MDNKYWKMIAVAFIIVSLIEFYYISWATSIGTGIINNENACADYCVYMNEYDAYYYEYYDDSCYCFTDGEVKETRIIVNGIIQ